ncbi:TetR family transcriptional regulator [Nocardia sp. NBC_00508]|uniref:TetR family transcriptional regulator n=1 Tax=Nocardia sp. NBC_00508 TaxID=2975992 RepID=UPI002E80428C|nr:TetR family transcriptional regulator [Nocardia sp. NBC_00508]WUD65860.1 TetR family transcriptional regulator [Nocardia sp. NBC_00508]
MGADMSLRERKKALTRAAVEDSAMQLFRERGYDLTTIDDICEASLISRRTFFRYFTSKEDVLLARFREHLTEAASFLNSRPAKEPIPDSLLALCNELTARYFDNNPNQVNALRIIQETPALTLGHLQALNNFEKLLRDFVASRTKKEPDAVQVRLPAAAAVTAFRVAMEAWLDSDGRQSLRRLARNNLELLIGDWH